MEYEGNHISACPHTSVTLTCTATRVISLKWYAVPGLPDPGRIFLPTHEDNTAFQDDIFTLTLVEVANHTDNRFFADFISTLEVMVDDLHIDNGTIVICEAGGEQEQLGINKRSKKHACCDIINVYGNYYTLLSVAPPSFQSQVTVDFLTENFSIILSWDVQNSSHVDGYRISVTSTTQPAVDTNKTTIALEGQYNIPLLINITAINCAGISEELVVVNEGMCTHTCSSMYMYMSWK